MFKFFSILRKRFNNFVFESMIQSLEESGYKRDELVGKVIVDISAILLITPRVFGGGWEKISLGKNVKLVNTLLNVSSGSIYVGDHSFFGHNVSLLTGTHFVNETNAQRQLWPFEGHNIVIGKGVWIASNATVLGPCEIEDNVVVAAGSVVIGGKLDAGCLYAGIPAKKVKEII